ncbi:hypothetical protein AGR2A_Cc100208 [Agrobacterium genomosp. 2 str. CFBP 5494]|uniref:Uncharacterized protein n=1 Tax=Agrobacterium genomosp. 2 str. CFBP 5494 TaxID=1183436 RepID=A0A9W5AYF5_9HYPH|nr:hypothetical protein AGR2A_Cc100208 [Agrobacterium genomosp. 2 str. CFBP 5494]
MRWVTGLWASIMGSRVVLLKSQCCVGTGTVEALKLRPIVTYDPLNCSTATFGAASVRYSQERSRNR